MLKLPATLTAVALSVISVQTFATDLLGTYWRLSTLSGAPIEVADATTHPHIILHDADKRLAGFGGCNRFFGIYDGTEAEFTLRVMGGSRQQCDDVMALEQGLLRALALTRAYSIDGDTLKLSGADGEVAEFVMTEPDTPAKRQTSP